MVIPKFDFLFLPFLCDANAKMEIHVCNVLLFQLISWQYTRNSSAADEIKEQKSEMGVISFVLEELIENDPD